MPQSSAADRRAYQRAWKRNNPEKVRRSNRIQRLKRYGLTVAEYEAMHVAQEGLCAICGGENEDARPLYVDHDHASGRARALLCHHCNFFIGAARERPDVLEAGARYLREWKETVGTAC